MKKQYRQLKRGETVKDGDEINISVEREKEVWVKCVESVGSIVWNRKFRRKTSKGG